MTSPRPEKPTAADLYGLRQPDVAHGVPAGQGQWISSPKFFGNTKFKQKKMYGFIKDTFTDFEPDEKQQVIHALSHEAALEVAARRRRPRCEDYRDGVSLIKDNCTECHTFHGQGHGKRPRPDGLRQPRLADRHRQQSGPQAILRNENDRMPAFAESATDPKKNILTRQELELLADWLRGEWYEPEKP